MTSYIRHREDLSTLSARLAAKSNSIVISEDRYAEAVSLLKGEITSTRNLRRWINQHNFRLMDMPGLGGVDIMVSEIKDPKDGSRYRRVIPASMMYDVIHQVHTEELQHSGYKKVEALVSSLLVFSQFYHKQD